MMMATTAPSDISPSTPRLTTPTRSESTSPIAPRASTPPARTATERMPASTSIGRASGRSRPRADEAVMGQLVADGGEEKDQSDQRQHGVGVDALGLQHDAGIEDDRHEGGGGDHAETRGAGEDRHHDADIAEIVGDAAL